MIKFLIKAGIAGGTVYYVADQGVWKESTEAIKVCDKITVAAQPCVSEIKKKLPFEIPELPKSEKVSFLIKQYWNNAVMSSFEYLAELPDRTSKLTQRGFNAAMQNEEMKKFLDSFSSEKK